VRLSREHLTALDGDSGEHRERLFRPFECSFKAGCQLIELTMMLASGFAIVNSNVMVG
jgi:hypothetical protein